MGQVPRLRDKFTQQIVLHFRAKQEPRDAHSVHSRYKLPFKSEIKGLAWDLVHLWSPQLTLLALRGEVGALAGSHSLGLLAGSRCPQTASCGGVVQTDRSLWEAGI